MGCWQAKYGQRSCKDGCLSPQIVSNLLTMHNSPSHSQSDWPLPWFMRIATLAIPISLLTSSVLAHPGHHDYSNTDSAPVSANQESSASGPELIAPDLAIPPNAIAGSAFTGIGTIAQVTPSWQNQVTISVQGNYRYISSNGIPNHTTGQFPNQGNPNRIAPQQHQFRVPLNPQAKTTATPMRLGKFGVALNGIPFEPGAAEFWNRNPRSGWQYEALSGQINLGLDRNNAHVQPGGLYHYHGLPTGLISKLGSSNRMMLLGYAADGFPIYGPYGYTNARDRNSGIRRMNPSYRLKSGQRPSGPGGKHDGTFVQDYQYVAGAGNLDECNGRFGVTPEAPNGTYHYYLTTTFPFIPRCYKGTPDQSFQVRGMGFPGNGGQPAGRPPRGRHPGGRPLGPPPPHLYPPPR